jgi:hypothetical protein
VNVFTVYGEEITNSKICNKCNIEKPLSEFNHRTRDKNGNPKELRNDCKSCQTTQGNVVKKLKKYNSQPNPVNHKCECCNKGTEDFANTQWVKNPFVLDHDHITGEFRGWICQYCNTALSRVNDSIETLQRMIEYLSKGRTISKNVNLIYTADNGSI